MEFKATLNCASLSNLISQLLADETSIINLDSEGLTIIIYRPKNSKFVLSLNLLKEFFKIFVCNQAYRGIFDTIPLFNDILHLDKVCKFSNVEFSVDGYCSAGCTLSLEFKDSPRFCPFTRRYLTSSRLPREYDRGQVDYSTFVSIDTKDFKDILWFSVNVSWVPITITCSNIKFQLVDREVTLTTQKGECIIGGVAKGEKIEVPILFYPVEFFSKIDSERMWLFLSQSDPSSAILIAPMGLNAEIRINFPHPFFTVFQWKVVTLHITNS